MNFSPNAITRSKLVRFTDGCTMVGRESKVKSKSQSWYLWGKNKSALQEQTGLASVD